MTKQIAQKNPNKRLFFILLAVVVGMFGFGFALIPVYNVMCKQLGINGKTENKSIAAIKTIDKSRTITIEFVANANAQLPWDFYPLTTEVKLHPGENVLINFYAKNNSPDRMTVQAIPSVAPGLAANYLKKTECFCFTQQTFGGREGRKMPVLFHIDPDLPKNIHEITLSYTMFDTAKLGHVIVSNLPGHIQ